MVHKPGSWGGSSRGACGLTRRGRLFRIGMYETFHRRILLLIVPFQCWRSDVRCPWGSWRRKLRACRLGVSLLLVLVEMHLPGWWWRYLAENTSGASARLVEGGSWSFGNSRSLARPNWRFCPFASWLAGVMCDDSGVARSFACSWPFLGRTEAAGCLQERSSRWSLGSSQDLVTCHLWCNRLRRRKPCLAWVPVCRSWSKGLRVERCSSG